MLCHAVLCCAALCLSTIQMQLLAQEPEVLEPGAGAGTQDVTELDAWQKCGALAAVGMSIDEVSSPHLLCLHPEVMSAVLTGTVDLAFCTEMVALHCTSHGKRRVAICT